MKTWKRFGDDCPECGGIAEVYTKARLGKAIDGDPARCDECHWSGWVTVDEDGRAWVDWEDSPAGKETE